MIALVHLNKAYRQDGAVTVVARDLCFTFPPGEAVGLLGRNGAGKSSLLRMIAGTMMPDSGRVEVTGSVSWPVGFAGSFHNDLTGAQNTRFVARIYGRDTGEVLRFVEGFAELGPHLHLPVRGYSAGMKARLAFALSMAVPFDTYLIDEITAVGDLAFRRRSEEMLNQRLRRSGAIVVSHSMELLARLCRSGAVLEKGRLFFYARIERAIEHHACLMRGELPPWMRGPGVRAGPVAGG